MQAPRAPDAIAAVILVGGRSQRMGHPKPTLALAGRPLLARVLDVARPLASEIVLVAAEGQTLPPELLRHDAGLVRVVHDRLVAAGPLPALALGLTVIAAPIAVALPCDAPFVRPAVLADLVGRLTAPGGAAVDAVVPRWGGRLQPLVAAYRRGLAPVLDALVAEGERRLQAVERLPNVRVVDEDALRPLDPGGDSFRVLNTPADLAAAERTLAGRL
jgi:molybdopterin-guanine dinucleotide biosynthesis protein A